MRLVDVERKILEQHKEVRARVAGLNQSVERIDLPWALAALRVLLLRFANYFEDHLGFEERELVPRMREVEAWGPLRVEALFEEHADQRRRLERVCALVEDPITITSRDMIIGAVEELTSSLMADMAHEEEMLEELRCVDQPNQMTG